MGGIIVGEQFLLPHDVAGLWPDDAGVAGHWPWFAIVLACMVAAGVIWALMRALDKRRKRRGGGAAVVGPPALPEIGSAKAWVGEASLQFYRNYFAWLTKTAFPGTPEGMTPREFGSSHVSLKDVCVRVERAVFAGEFIPFEEASKDWEQLGKLRRHAEPKQSGPWADLPSEIARKREASRR